MNARALPRSLADPPREITPWQALACAVLRQAVLDAREHPRAWGRDMAAGWLHGEWCRFWCAVAGVDPAIVIERGLKRRNQDVADGGTGGR